MRPLVVGIVNVTPDSFSDGGQHATPQAAVAHALALVEEGADALDVGGESTRPGATPVPADEEAARVVPVVAALRERGVALPVFVDTRKAAVAAAALAAGATMVNDVSAGLDDPAMLATAARAGAGVVLMHKQGDPATMQRAPRYGDVVEEVLAHLVARADAAQAAGVPPERIWVDPGIGFGKTFAHNEALLRALERFVATGRPVLLGASRKAFLGAITGRPVLERLAGSLACAARAAQAGVRAVRVHDVAATVDLLAVLDRVAPP
ncbi:MAG: dihydropteroate synthase [Planctomycetes bacterium]|nr:dihydropteroate synthase [Planctomycetota bacterium]